MTTPVWLRRLREAHNDEGATLVIALIIVTTIALVTGAVLSHTWTNSAATITFRGVANTSYAGDAAAKVAINELRLGSSSPDWVAPSFNGSWTSWGWVFTNNSDSTGCFGASGTAASPVLKNALELDGSALAGFYPRSGRQVANSSARVECAPVAGTGILSSDGVDIGDVDPNSTDTFARALTTLGTSSDPHDGVYVNALGSGNTNAAPMGGGVISKTNVKVDHGDLSTDGYVWANGSCTLGTGRVVSPDTECPKSGGVLTPDVPASPISTVPTLVDPSTITNCHFPAGSYVNGQTLSAAVNACDTPAHPIAYFDDTSHGPYYFDFADSGHTWNIDTEVIGGVPSGSTTIPGACLSPITNDPIAGVQFVFGGASQITLTNNAQVEICGPSNSGDAPLTIFQQQTAGPSATTSPTATAPPVITPGSFGPDAAGAVKSDAFSNNSVDDFKPNSGTPAWNVPAANLATSGDGLGATWTSTHNGDTGAITLTNFADSIPAGATVTSATVHVDLSGTRSPDVTPAVSLAGIALGTITSSTDLTLTSAQRAQLTTAAASSALNPTIKVTIPTTSGGGPGTPANAHTVTVDKVTVSVNYTTSSVPPPPPPTTVTIEPATNTTFIRSPNNFKGTFVIQGSTYAPQGYVDLEPGNDPGDLVAFRWGLVAQAVYFETYPQQLFGYPLVSIPNPGHGIGSRVTVVDLKVYVCVASSPCNSGGQQSLTARVMITDPPYNTSGTYAHTPEPGRRQIRIIGWAEQH